MMDKLPQKLLFTISTVPAVSYLLIVALAGYTAWLRGEWPHYSNPDPKSLDLPTITAVVDVFIYLSLYAVPLTLVALPFLWLIGGEKWRQSQGRLTIYALGIPVFFTLLAIVDVSLIDGPLNWYLD